MLACFVADMKETYNPYVDATMRVVAPLSKDSCYDDIRLACLASLPDMLKIVRYVLEPYKRMFIVSLTNITNNTVSLTGSTGRPVSATKTHTTLYICCATHIGRYSK